MAKQPPGCIHLAEQTLPPGIDNAKQIEKRRHPAVSTLFLLLIINNLVNLFWGRVLQY